MNRKTEKYYYYFGVDILHRRALAEIGWEILKFLKRSPVKPLLARYVSNRDYLFNEHIDLDPASRDPVALFPTPGWFETVAKDHYQESNYDDSEILARIREFCDDQISKTQRDIEYELKRNPNDNSPWYSRDEYIDSCKESINDYLKLKDQTTFTKSPAVKTVGFLLLDKPENLDSLIEQVKKFFAQEDPAEAQLNFRLITQKVIEWNEIYETEFDASKNSKTNT